MNIINTRKYLSLRSPKFLIPWMATGLAAQLGLVFWPISNYSTLVYLLFFLPLLILFILKHKHFGHLISATPNRPVSIALLALLTWVVLSSLWANLNDSNGLELFTKTLKINTLIVTYVLGVAFLTHHSPKFLFACLITGASLVATIALISLVEQFLLKNLSLTGRMSIYGMGDWVVIVNPVAAGIYFGMFSVLTGAILITPPARKNLAASILTGVTFTICFFTTYFTGTRTALVAFLITLAIVLLFLKRWAFLLLLGAGVIGLLCYGLLEDSSHLKGYLLRGGFGSWRPQIWVAAWEVGIQHFWIGSGMWTNTDLIVTRGDTTATMPHSHNFYLQLLNWSGVVGLSLYAVLIALVIKLATSMLNKPLVFLSISILIYFLIVQLFDVYNIFTKPSYYWPCIWLPLGIIIGHAYDSEPERKTMPL